MILTAPSKTFLLGEYGVLKDSPSLVLCMSPDFKLKIEENNGSEPAKIPADFQGAFSDFFKSYTHSQCQYEFIDPWNHEGGFGASSAQFALLYQAYTHQDMSPQSIKDMIPVYRKYFWNNEGLAPSGHDVIAQRMGKGLCFIDPVQEKFEKVSIELEGYDFFILKTNQKISTHLHLNQLQVIHFDLREIVLQAKQGFENNNLLQVVSAIEEQNRILFENNLICSETLHYRKKLEQEDGVIVTKGCGALGADTIFILCEQEQSSLFLEKYPTALKFERSP